MRPEEGAVVFLGGLYDALFGNAAGAEGCNEGTALAAQHENVRVAFVQVVVKCRELILIHEIPLVVVASFYVQWQRTVHPAQAYSPNVVEGEFSEVASSVERSPAPEFTREASRGIIYW